MVQNGETLPHRIGDLENSKIKFKLPAKLPHRIGDLENFLNIGKVSPQLPHRIGDLEMCNTARL